jgi:hypothetical protein
MAVRWKKGIYFGWITLPNSGESGYRLLDGLRGSFAE